MSSPDSYTVEIGWKGSTTGIFTIGTSTLDGADTLGSSLPSGFVAEDDMTGYHPTVDWQRGRDSNMGEMQMGTATITFTDPDQDLNPANPASPFAGTLELRRPVRVRATFDAVTYPLFYQFVRQIEPRPEDKQTLVHCVDLFWFLNRIRPVLTQMTDVTTGEAIGEILDTIGWTDPGMRDLGMGDMLAEWPADDMPADGSRNALQLVSELLEAELGIFYVDAAGVAVYKDRHMLHGHTVPIHDLAGVATYVEGGPDLELVRNRARVTRVGGVEQEAVDQVSIDLYGDADFPQIETPYVATDDMASSLAHELVLHHGRPTPPVWSLNLDSTAGDAVLVAMLDANLGDHVTLAEEVTGIEGLHHIEAMQGHAEYRLLTTTWTLSKVPDFHPFTIGESTIDGPDVLVY